MLVDRIRDDGLSRLRQHVMGSHPDKATNATTIGTNGHVGGGDR